MTKTVTAHCSKCLGERRHELLHIEKTFWSEEVNGGRNQISSTDTYEMLKCLGCETVMLRHTNDFSEGDGPEVRYYPPAVRRQEPSWFNELYNLPSRFIHDVLEEIYIALANNSRRLATMGVRALLEHVMIDKVGDNGTFKANLAEFERQEYVAAKQRKMLEVVLKTGHAAMHRSYKPSMDDLEAVLSIVETLIQSIYVHEAKSKKIKVPSRRRPRTVKPKPITPP